MNATPLARAATVFQAAFGQAPSIQVQAPGRVNLIGEHTDYNDGLVLPCAIDYRTVIVARPRDDRQIRVAAADYDGALDAYALDAPIERLDAPMWANYVRGVVRDCEAIEQAHAQGIPTDALRQQLETSLRTLLRELAEALSAIEASS